LSVWMVLHVSEGEKRAESIKKLLLDEGLLVKLQPVSLAETTSNLVQVMVLSSELAEAKKILANRGYL
jgi:hypothetical protein